MIRKAWIDSNEKLNFFYAMCCSCRATAKEMLNHEWIKKPSDKPLGNAVLDRIRGFAAMNKLKKEALKVIAENLPKEEIEGLKQMFISIDADRNGTITVDELRQVCTSFVFVSLRPTWFL